ncbi:bacteriocin immunity protein [Algibacter sp. L4_22]|uniref:bacteriocin immunity protein n=1 Tax=Algibacter sp. L4_22 TaxID=2942477 RepID=UPI00201B745C|nr:bacteriocin immunity protein [Algibacter sp. L4_22]MCL5130538.1 bacteriocin immunity protein [Algibacter sp. L4_22]
MKRKELIELGKRIIKAEGTERELDELYEIFNKNVPYPNGANLFYYPENYNARKDNLNLYNPTVESIVDKCLNYKAINL